MEKVIGIDLGTTNSAAAIYMQGKAIMLQAAEGPISGGAKSFPSIVSISKDGRVTVGETARKRLVSNPERTINNVKRKMGKDFKYTIDGKEYSPQQITAYILQKIKNDAESFLGFPVNKAVVTVPAYFDDNQRQATKDAGKIAGLEVLRILNEPTAASLAYGLNKSEKDLKIMVFDLGGGTLDVVILEFGSGVFMVKSVAGDTELGGSDMDGAILEYVIENFREKSGIEIKDDNMALNRIREAVEKAKIELSYVESTDINLPFIYYDKSSGPVNLFMPLSRGKLEELLTPMIDLCIPPIEQALSDANFFKQDIDKVILIGGPTRMPLVRQLIKKIMNKEPELSVDPSDTVAKGASIMGATMSGEEALSTTIQLVDVTPFTLGVETIGGKKESIIHRNSMIPTRRSRLFTTTVDDQKIVTVHVVQGESPVVKDCISLGKFDLTIPPANKGVSQIEVAFEIDVNGILNVTAKDLIMLREAKVTINTRNRLSDEEIDQIRSELN